MEDLSQTIPVYPVACSTCPTYRIFMVYLFICTNYLADMAHHVPDCFTVLGVVRYV